MTRRRLDWLQFGVAGAALLMLVGSYLLLWLPAEGKLEAAQVIEQRRARLVSDIAAEAHVRAQVQRDVQDFAAALDLSRNELARATPPAGVMPQLAVLAEDYDVIVEQVRPSEGKGTPDARAIDYELSLSGELEDLLTWLAAVEQSYPLHRVRELRLMAPKGRGGGPEDSRGARMVSAMTRLTLYWPTLESTSTTDERGSAAGGAS